MEHEVYKLEAADDFNSFDFVSVGKKGNIPKRIVFKRVGLRAYTLVFGDVMEDDRIDDHSVSNNGDRDKIFGTIISAIDQYTTRYPKRSIYFMASTDSRTRLYRRVISLRWEELSRKYLIYVDVDSESGWVPFQKNMEIIAFSIVRKLF